MKKTNKPKTLHEKFHDGAARAIRTAARTKSSVDFKFDAMKYRAWPEGSVTQLDRDGDSVKTVIPQPPRLIVVAASVALTQCLEHRLKSGLFGRTIEEVAERLLCEACRGKIVVQ